MESEQSKFNQINSKAYDQMATLYNSSIQNKQSVYDSFSYQKFIHQLHSLKKNQNDKISILELGSGNCQPMGLQILKFQKNTCYIGVQLSQKQCFLAEENIKKLTQQTQNISSPLFNKQLNYKIYKQCMIQFTKKCQSNSYHGVLMMYSLLHLTLSSQIELFLEIYKCLKQQGLFYLNVIFQKDQAYQKKFQNGQIVRFGQSENFFGQKVYFCNMTKQWYIHTLKLLGFQNIYCNRKAIIMKSKKQQADYLIFRKLKIIENK